MTKVFYLPFGTQTYVLVTRRTIEKEATCVFEMSSDSEEAARLKRLLQDGSESSFDDRGRTCPTTW